MMQEIEYKGVKAVLREPIGREAVEFVKDMRKLPAPPPPVPLPDGVTDPKDLTPEQIAALPPVTEEEAARTEAFAIEFAGLVHDWMPRLVVEPAECAGNGEKCYELWKGLGKLGGPLIGAFTAFAGESAIIPMEKLDALPFRDRAGAAPLGGEADAD